MDGLIIIGSGFPFFLGVLVLAVLVCDGFVQDGAMGL